MLMLLCFFMVFTMLSCSPENQQGMQDPTPAIESATVKLEIQPLEATRETTFYIQSKDIDLSKAKIQWFVNDIPVEGATATQFKPPEIKKGDFVQAKITINNREMESNLIKVKNIPPTITRARIVPPVPKSEDTLKIDVNGNDRDGDEVSYRYEWFKNGEPAGSMETLEGPFRRGDKISVKITPYDGEAYGEPIIITSNIYNSPPKPSGGDERFENNVYSYHIKASDPDGDTLTYSLKSAPSGMTINPSTGLIQWNVPPDFKGRVSVVVSVSDGHGGEAMQAFELKIGL